MQRTGHWTRRRFLESLALAGASAKAWTVAAQAAAPNPVPFANSCEDLADKTFPQGVASGDPRPDGFLLWTRVPSAAADTVAFQVAEDDSFTRIVRAGEVQVGSDADFTVRVRTDQLEPNRRYWYRFRSRDVSSPIGRTRTAPMHDQDVPVNLAFASCQDYQGRYYYAWRALADRADDLDFVLFLGDYIYEYERYPGLQEPQPGREIRMPDGLVIDEPNGVIAARTLEDYRELYRVTRSDPDLRRIHQLCPFVIIWDDHEHANDAWQDHAVDFNDRQGDEKDTGRREAATRAWFEHLPIDVEYHADERFPDDVRTWRTLRWGKHLELFLTDERYYRHDHVIPEGPIDRDVGKLIPFSPVGSRTFCRKEPFAQREAEINPSMLGLQQADWLVDAVQHSNATWKVWASALMVAQFVLDLRPFDHLPPMFRHTFYFKTDQWDGFLSERKRILQALSKVDNLVVLSGDLHGFYASHLLTDFDDATASPIGVEFTVAGVSSISLLEQIEAIVAAQPLLRSGGLGKLLDRFDETLSASSPHFVHADSRGYGVAIALLSETSLDVEFLPVTGVRDPHWNGKVKALQFHVNSGSAKIELRNHPDA